MNYKIKKCEKRRHIVGYAIGILIFTIIIPSVIYAISQIGHPFFSIPIIDSITFRFVIAAILCVVGLIFTIWSNIDLFRKGEGGPTDIFNIEISPRSKKLVVTGPYRYTRNPMVFGVNSLYFAVAILINSLASLVFCFSFLFVVILYLKLTEEKRLQKDFGGVYLDYKKSVSMIIPFLKIRIIDFVFRKLSKL